MQIQGTVKEIEQPVKGESKVTGKPYISQNFVLELPSNNSQYPQYVVLNLFGEDKIESAKLYVGKEVKVQINFNAKQYNGKWFNSLNAWSVESVGEEYAQVKTQQQTTQQTQQTTQENKQAPKKDVAKQTPPPQMDNSDIQDLPF